MVFISLFICPTSPLFLSDSFFRLSSLDSIAASWDFRPEVSMLFSFALKSVNSALKADMFIQERAEIIPTTTNSNIVTICKRGDRS
ncbi:MAG: hypothetical protein ILNGONEN_01132 [Syntrophorhabdaceae bacterium]|nr:hypothetical protein [Syntrophorhabdaceae bacterium]